MWSFRRARIAYVGVDSSKVDVSEAGYPLPQPPYIYTTTRPL